MPVLIRILVAFADIEAIKHRRHVRLHRTNFIPLIISLFLLYIPCFQKYDATLGVRDEYLAFSQGYNRIGQ